MRRSFFKLNMIFAIALTLVMAPAGSGARADETGLSGGTSETGGGAIAALNAGTAALQSGNARAALDYLDKALQSGGLSAQGEAMAYHHRGIANLQLGQPGHAVADYTNAIWRDALPADILPRAYYNRAAAYSRTGDAARAEKDYSKALELNPDYAVAYHNRANIRRQQGRYGEAIADYNAAIDANMGKRAALSFFGRGMAKDANGDKLGAVEDIEKAVALDPSFTLARETLSAMAPQLTPEKLAENKPVAPLPVLPAQKQKPLEVKSLSPIGASAALSEPKQEPGAKEPARTAAITPPAAAPVPRSPSLALEEIRAPQVQVARLETALPKNAPEKVKPEKTQEVASPLAAPSRAPIEESAPQAATAAQDPWSATNARDVKLASLSGWKATVIRYAAAANGVPQGQISLKKPAVPADRSLTGSLPPASRPATAALQTQADALRYAQASAEEPVQNDAGALPTYRVQIGSFRSPSDASASWTKATAKHPALLKDMQPYIVEADLGEKGLYYRLQIGAFSGFSKAEGLCRSLKAEGTDCFVKRASAASQ
ncbi:sporulation domain-containing protein [Tepidicaulis marinus]|uniref:Sporulation domain-containing protein n=1 Tax=Tepidicaulis marinus TaxID=1333998 RepID=A0A081B7E1_9HYPH|nr:tetratricopeptide repeat protein [Tepidicaulis marinus]GAK43959.1 sporulation domain-containing protein [Tepidicaulis marinus]